MARCDRPPIPTLKWKPMPPALADGTTDSDAVVAAIAINVLMFMFM
jgi:hypothetical protein